MNPAVYSRWDSGIFGYMVAKMYVGERDRVSEEQIAEEGKRFDVVFVSTKMWVDFLLPPPGLDHLYDMEYSFTLHPPAPAISATDETILADATDRHREIAQRSFPDSRFLLDPLLKGNAPELYARWVSDNRIHVVASEPDNAFLVAKRDIDGAARISLVAVDEKFRGTGLGELLVRNVIEKSPGTWKVKVSARNHRAIRFYEKLGFRVKDAWTVFHVWPKNFGRL